MALYLISEWTEALKTLGSVTEAIILLYGLGKDDAGKHMFRLEIIGGESSLQLRLK